MNDLATEIRRYVDGIDEPFDPASLIERAERVPPTPQKAPPSLGRGVLIAAAAAVAVLVAVGGALVIGGPFGDSSSPVATEPPPATTIPQPPTETTLPAPASTAATTSTVPPTTLEPVASGPISGDGWTRSTTGLVGTGTIYGVAGRGDTVVAVGPASAPCRWPNEVGGQGCQPTAWVSQDHGESWAAIELDGSGDNPYAVTATEEGFVAVGFEGVNRNPPQGGISWTSPDGVTWERHKDDTLIGVSLTDVAAGPVGLVAAASCWPSRKCPPSVWTSPDGREWSLLHEFELQTTLTNLYPVDIAVHDGGYAVAATLEGEISELEQYLHVWTSLDGRTWEEHALESNFDDGVALVVASEHGIVATQVWGRLLAEYSPDGTEWTPVEFECRSEPQLASPFEPDTWPLRDVATTADGFVAVARCKRLTVWMSNTGATWRLVSTDHEVFAGDPQAVYADDKGVIVFGTGSDIWTTTELP